MDPLNVDLSLTNGTFTVPHPTPNGSRSRLPVGGFVTESAANDWRRSVTMDGCVSCGATGNLCTPCALEVKRLLSDG